MKKKALILIVATALFLCLLITTVLVPVLFVPVLFVPTSQNVYLDGGTREYEALAIKIVVWNRLVAKGDDVYTYRNTSVYYGKNKDKTIDELWKIEWARNASVNLQ